MTAEDTEVVEFNDLATTPFDAIKTAELDIQFNINPAYGLTRERYGWYSNDTLFDSTHFTEGEGEILVETSATGTDTARIRSSYPGTYYAHTVAEPGIGVTIPSQHIQRDANNLTSLTHGEISVEAVEWDESTDSGVNALGLSFESDAVYIQIRKSNANMAFVPQEDWNIDPMDGTGPSGKILRPEDGYVYNFPFSWYGHGALYVAIQDTDSSEMLPVHKEVIDGEVSIGAPSMPVQVTVENQGTADPLGANLGGMQWATHGSSALEPSERGRSTSVSRVTSGGTINVNYTTTNGEIDPFAEPGVPLMSVRRDLTSLNSRTALRLGLGDIIANTDADVILTIFDEFNEGTALTGANFREPNIQQLSEESRIQVDTEATDYTPGPNAVVRQVVYVSASKDSANVLTQNSNNRLPLEATGVVTAMIPTGVSNQTDANPAILTVNEGF